MQLQKSERPHISFFGCTNAGKSSVVNAVINQDLSVVSEVKGTTTDPVSKSMEILPLGPVVITDTAGLDDNSELGALRVEKTRQILDKTDIAVLVIDSFVGVSDDDSAIIKEFNERKIPYVIVFNKTDLNVNLPSFLSLNSYGGTVLLASAKTGENINELREILGHIIDDNKKEKYIMKDKLEQGDVVILVIPIDESAPKGRIILPQQNVLREVLDAKAVAICCGVSELGKTLETITPKYVITDSQAFNTVKDIVPEDIILTSFSILMANYKGKLKQQTEAASKLSDLADGDKILISEGCTHHRQCNDIGTVKMPKWIKDFTGKQVEFEFTQGGEFPYDLSKYSLVVHCGGCMLNEQEMQNRLKRAAEQNVPVVNYGMAIAYMNGILERALQIFN